MIQTVATVGFWMSGIAFVLFVVVLLYQVFGPKPGVEAAGGAGDAAEQEGADAESFAKLIEAFAKLADSLNHAGPVVLLLMASIIFFVLALLAASLGTLKGETTGTPAPGPKTQSSPATSVCVVYAFDVGRHELGPEGLSHLKQTPDGCARSVVADVAGGAVSMLLLVGHADRQPLFGERLRYYGTNEELAYQRALEVKGALLGDYASAASPKLTREEFEQRIVALEGGWRYLGRRADGGQFALDRSVEMVACATGVPPSVQATDH